MRRGSGRFVTIANDFGIFYSMNLGVICTVFIFVVCAFVDAAEPAKPATKLQIYLLMGQSNMAGRGVVEKEDKTAHPRVLMFRTNGTWVPAIEPITRDANKTHGVGPGVAFGKAMAEKDPNVTIGLVPTAVGGTPLSRWVKGGDLYENAVREAKQAMKDGTLAGILWHQGESDTGTDEKANTYETRLAKMISDLRSDLGAPDAPFVCGELGHFLLSRTKNKPVPLTKIVNAALNDIPNKVPHTGCASAEGLKDKGDELHFDAASQREFGKRYAEVMWKLQNQK